MRKTTANPEQEFVTSAIAHHELAVSGDIKGSDAAHKKVASAMKTISQQQDKGESFLIEAIKDNRTSVRLWAATYLLPINTRTALSTLNSIRDGDCPWQLQAMAEVVIDQWKNGRLELI
jgi:hypothetical protein